MSVPATCGILAGVALCRLAKKKEDVRCCGIVGYAGPRNAEEILSEGINLLQNRGYDSCGMSTIKSGRLVTSKFASRGSTSDSISLLQKVTPEKHGKHHIGIAHTRWATHGSKTDVNAHPHHDWKNRISVVHNGTIDNFLELKQELTNKKIPFQSETDTEVIANLIGKYLDAGMDFESAVRETVSRLRGTWGLVVLHKDHPDEFVVARNGSPILLSAGNNELFVASEPLAMARYTSDYVALEDRDVVKVSTKTGFADIGPDKNILKIHATGIEMTPAPFKRWTLKEIHEQPKSLARALNHGGRICAEKHKVILGGLDANKDTLMNIKNLMITGCGTSLYAAMYGELIFEYLDCFDSVSVVDASEVDRKKFSKPFHRAGLLSLSQSGETRDTVTACQVAEDLNVPRFSIVNVVGSQLARMTGCGIYLNAGREVAVASTKAFTSQVACMALTGCWFSQNRKLDTDKVTKVSMCLQKLPLLAQHCLTLEGQCKKIASIIKDCQTMFVLGKGFGMPVALEGALKIKEISYIHAEGFGGGQLKHGPFALLDPQSHTPVVLLMFKDENMSLMLNAAQQVKARGGRLIVITDDPQTARSVTDHVIEVPSNGIFTALLATIPLQLLAYHLAELKGIDPDKPRGLAKTVTVE